MQLKLDDTRVYALALEGGGAKGAYEIGVWRALEEAGLRYNAVAGTSVGALNGAMMAQRTLQKAMDFWSRMRYSMVIDVDDNVMAKIMAKDWKGLDRRTLASFATSFLKDGGFDVAPLRELLKQAIDEKAVRTSDVDFYLVTVDLTERKTLDIRAKELKEGELYDMLLASAYLPVFKSEKLGGKRYADGGYSNALPYDVLLKNGYRDIIVVRLPGSIGRERRVSLPEDARLTTITAYRPLGSILNFSEEQSRFDMDLGYYDAQRVLYGLAGRWFYLERTWSEREAYELLSGVVERFYKAHTMPYTLCELHTKILPDIAKELDVEAADYYDIWTAYLESMGKFLGIKEFRVMQDKALYQEILASTNVIDDPAAPLCLRYLPLELRKG